MADIPYKGAYRTVRYLRAEADRSLRDRQLRGRRVPAQTGSLTCDVWVNEGADDKVCPLVVEIHGGGFALGDARKTDKLRDWIARTFDTHVVGVDYRLAPEYAAPAQRDDVVNAVRAACLGELGIEVDPTHVYLMGYSAGASLALSAAIELTRGAGIIPAGCILHYPYVDASESIPCDGDAIGLSAEMAHAFNVWYAGDRNPGDPLVSVLASDGDDLRRLPTCHVYPVVGDPLLPQAEALAARLAAADVDCRWVPVAGAYHGYLEDAADMAAYRAQTMDETLSSRPKGFLGVAKDVLRESLQRVLGPATRDIEINF